MNTRANALYAGGHPQAARRPLVILRIDGDELLARARGARLALHRGFAMARKVVMMWYL